MANPSKGKGTAAETAVVRFLRESGFIYAERRTLSGSADRGDVSGIPSVCIEIKACAKMALAQWLDEAEVERDNARAQIGVVWHKRRGFTNPGCWYVTMSGTDFVRLLEEPERRGSDGRPRKGISE